MTRRSIGFFEKTSSTNSDSVHQTLEKPLNKLISNIETIQAFRPSDAGEQALKCIAQGISKINQVINESALEETQEKSDTLADDKGPTPQNI